MARRTAPRPLDRNNPLPLWAQLVSDLERRLRAGAFDIRFPREYELVEQYGVSRDTVRAALRRMRAEGVLESDRGRGTWIRKVQIAQPLGAAYSLFRSVEALGLEQRSVVRKLDVRVDPDVALRLRKPSSTEFVYLERVRLVEGEPLSFDRAWLPTSFAAPLLQADFTHSGLYDELDRRIGERPTGGSEVITAVVPTAEQRRILEVRTGIAALTVHRTGCIDQEPVEWRESLIRADRFTLLADWSAREGYRMDVGASAPEADLTPRAERR